MSFFNKRRSMKRRAELSEDAKIFIQVHFVRERGGERYAYNTLLIKEDLERDSCVEWYKDHGNPDCFSEAFSCYLKEKNIDISKLAAAYHMDSRMLAQLPSSHDFKVSKGDAVALCLGLHLNLSHARALLKLAGYALTNSSESDLAIRYCIENGHTSYQDVSYILDDICQIRLKDLA